MTDSTSRKEGLLPKGATHPLIIRKATGSQMRDWTLAWILSHTPKIPWDGDLRKDGPGVGRKMERSAANREFPVVNKSYATHPNAKSSVNGDINA